MRKLIFSILAGLAAMGMAGWIFGEELIVPGPKPAPTRAVEYDARLVQRIDNFLEGDRTLLRIGDVEEIVKTYNAKMEAIRDNCENDIRCHKGKIIFKEVHDEKGIIRQLNKWITTKDTIYIRR